MRVLIFAVYILGILAHSSEEETITLPMMLSEVAVEDNHSQAFF